MRSAAFPISKRAYHSSSEVRAIMSVPCLRICQVCAVGFLAAMMWLLCVIAVVRNIRTLDEMGKRIRRDESDGCGLQMSSGGWGGSILFSESAFIHSRQPANSGIANFLTYRPWFVYSIQADQYADKSVQNAGSGENHPVSVSCA